MSVVKIHKTLKQSSNILVNKTLSSSTTKHNYLPYIVVLTLGQMKLILNVKKAEKQLTTKKKLENRIKRSLEKFYNSCILHIPYYYKTQAHKLVKHDITEISCFTQDTRMVTVKTLTEGKNSRKRRELHALWFQGHDNRTMAVKIYL